MVNNLLDRLPIIGSKKKIICPRCLTPQVVEKNRDGQVCTEPVDGVFPGDTEPCGYRFPLRYIQNYGEAKAVPVQVFGWSNHGKTVFLDVLRLTLMEMKRVWPEYTYMPLTEHDQNKERDLRVDVKNGIMPGSTRLKGREENEIYLMQLNYMARWGSRMLVIMDHAGERFRDFELKVHEIPFLTNPQTTTLMLISVPMLRGEMKIRKPGSNLSIHAEAPSTLPEDKGSDFGHSMDHLLNIYIEAMAKYDARQERENRNILKQFVRPRRKIVVVLTMADKFLHDLPPALRDYLMDDDMWDRLFYQNTQPLTNEQMETYLSKMLEVSNTIRDWLKHDDRIPGGAQLVGLIEKHNIEARYSIISATGHDEVSQSKEDRVRIGTEIAPKRVIDPFFWVLEYQDK